MAYDRVGVNELQKVYDAVAACECVRLGSALRAVAVENEPNPVPCKWNALNNIRRIEELQ